MAKIYCVKVYLTRPQYEKVKGDAQIRGIRAVSAYIRSIVAGNGVFIEQKIVENNRILKKLEGALLPPAKNEKAIYSREA